MFHKPNMTYISSWYYLIFNMFKSGSTNQTCRELMNGPPVGSTPNRMIHEGRKAMVVIRWLWNGATGHQLTLLLSLEPQLVNRIQRKYVKVEFVDSYTVISVISQWNFVKISQVTWWQTPQNSRRDCQLQVEGPRSHVSSGWPNLCSGGKPSSRGATILVKYVLKKTADASWTFAGVNILHFSDQHSNIGHKKDAVSRSGIWRHTLGYSTTGGDFCGSWAAWHG